MIMKKTQKPLSFSLCAENIAYVEQEFKARHRNKSHWMDDLLTHLRSKKAPVSKVPRSKAKTYPKNMDDRFSMLWDIKGKKGSKKNAYAKFKLLAAGSTEDGCEDFTQMLIDDILKRQHEIGVKEQHLVTYLNQENWDRE